MELAKSLTEGATAYLREHGVSLLPHKIGGAPFYVAATDDQTILAHGVVRFNGVEYKIGTLREISGD